MKSSFYIIWLFVCASVFISSCGRKPVSQKRNTENTDSTSNINQTNKKPIKKNNRTNDSADAVLFHAIDTARLQKDTVLHFQTYELLIAREKYDASHKRISSDDIWFNSITIYVLKNGDDSAAYKQKFEENQFVNTYSFKNNTENYISLSINGGGSGFTSNMYKIEAEKSVQFKKVFSYTEMSYYSFNNDGTEILCLHGIWDLFSESNDGEINETHFADHAYEVFTVNLAGSTPVTMNHGITKFKYPSEDSGTTLFELFNLIQKKEPNISKEIHFENYPQK